MSATDEKNTEEDADEAPKRSRLWPRLAYRGIRLVLEFLGLTSISSLAKFLGHLKLHPIVELIVTNYRKTTYAGYDTLFGLLAPSLHVSGETKDALTLFILTTYAVYIESRERDKRDQVTNAFLAVARNLARENVYPFDSELSGRDSALYAPLRSLFKTALTPLAYLAAVIEFALLGSAAWHFQAYLEPIPWRLYAAFVCWTAFGFSLQWIDPLDSLSRWLHIHHHAPVWRFVHTLFVLLILFLALPALALVAFYIVSQALVAGIMFVIYVVIFVATSPVLAWRTSSATILLFVATLILGNLAERGLI